MRRLFFVVLAGLFISACAGLAPNQGDPGPTVSRSNQPTLVPVSRAELPSVEVEPSVAPAFDCSQPAELSLGFTVWRSPSLGLGGLNELYVVPIHLDRLLAGKLAEPDGYPSVFRMRGLEPSDYETCRITFTEDRRERMADWSPSGDRILVYESTVRCNGDACPQARSDLYVYDVSDGLSEKIASLTNDYNGDPGVLDLNAAFSPDGSRVAYIDGDRERGGRRIVVVDLADRTATPLVTSDNDAATVTSMQWSPDGNSILFARDCRPAPSSGEEVPEPCSGIWSLAVAQPPDGRVSGRFSPQQPYALGEGREPVWSPDGRAIAFSNFAGIWVVKADGSDKKLVAPWCAEWACGRVRWSPDGQYLALKHDSDQRQSTGAYGDEVWLMAADGTSKRRLSPELVEVSGPAQWSPDGEWLAYAGCSRWGCRPYVSRVDGSATILVPIVASIESSSVLQWQP